MNNLFSIVTPSKRSPGENCFNYWYFGQIAAQLVNKTFLGSFLNFQNIFTTEEGDFVNTMKTTNCNLSFDCWKDLFELQVYKWKRGGWRALWSLAFLSLRQFLCSSAPNNHRSSETGFSRRKPHFIIRFDYLYHWNFTHEINYKSLRIETKSQENNVKNIVVSSYHT